MTALGHLGCTIDIKRLASSLRNAELRLGTFRVVYVKMGPQIRGTALVFSTGKVLMTGTWAIPEGQRWV